MESDNKIKVIYCGCCGCYHPIDWYGDCRDDDNRFNGDEDNIEIMEDFENDVY